MKKTRRTVTTKDLVYIKNNLHKSDAIIAKDLGRARATIIDLRRKHGIYRETKPTICQPRPIAWNKGGLGTCCKPRGLFIVKRNDKQYYKQSLGYGRSVFLHMQVWRENYGDLPKYCGIRFKDGNTLNCDIDNLECVSKNDLYLAAVRRRPALNPEEQLAKNKAKNRRAYLRKKARKSMGKKELSFTDKVLLGLI